MASVIVNGVVLTERDQLEEKWRWVLKKSPEHGWASRQDFIKWALSTGFSPEKTLMRKDSSKPHSPDNCYWKMCQGVYREGLTADHEQAVAWNKTVNRFRRALGLPLFPEK